MLRAIARSERPDSDISYLYFFLIAVAYKVPWTAISSLLGQFTAVFQQPRILLWLNLAYFIPSVPVLFIHSSLQDRLEQHMGMARATLARLVLGLGGLVLLCLALPYCCSNLQLLLVATASVGVCYSIAFGTSYQLVTHFPPTCTVALTTGFVSCGIVVLLADLMIKRGPYYTPTGVARLFQVVALQTFIGLLAATALLRKHWKRLSSASAGKVNSYNSVTERLSAAAGQSGLALGVSRSGRPDMGLPVRNEITTGFTCSTDYGEGLGLRHRLEHEPVLHNSGSSSLQQSQQQQGHCCSTALAETSAAAGAAAAHTPSVAIHLGMEQRQSSPAGAAAAPVSIKQHSSSSSSSSGGSSSNTSRTRVRRLIRPLQRLRHRCQAVALSFTLLLHVAAATWPAWCGLLLSVGSSMIAFPFFTYVPHSGVLGAQLAQVLFYARLLGDILGRLVPHWLHLRSSTAVLTAAACKAALLLLLVPAMLQPTLVGGDVPLAMLVAGYWWLSGYINTGTYLLAPKLAADGVSSGKMRLISVSSCSSVEDSKAGVGHVNVRAKAGGLMAFCFQVSCFLGLMCSWGLQSSMLAEWTHPGFSAGHV